jgi:hypothetical protein
VGKFQWESCSRCGIPDFMALEFTTVKGKNVCEKCLTSAEVRRILRERYKKLGLDDSELKGKDYGNQKKK